MDNISNQELKTLCLEKFEITGFPEEKPVFHEKYDALSLLCNTSCNLRIKFWGDPEDGFQNINLLKCQKLPIIVAFDHTDCLPSGKARKNIAYSVPAHIEITLMQGEGRLD